MAVSYENRPLSELYPLPLYFTYANAEGMSIPPRRPLRLQLFMGGGYKAVRGLISLDITYTVCVKSNKIFLNFKTNCLCNKFFCKCLFIQAKPSLQLTNIYFVFFLSHNVNKMIFFKYKKIPRKICRKYY